MKEKLIDKKIITYGDDFLAEMEISYILTEDLCSPGMRYGVRLVKETIENGAHICEDNTTDMLFSSRSDALDFINMLIKYEVTTIALPYVVKDYMHCRYGGIMSA